MISEIVLFVGGLEDSLSLSFCALNCALMAFALHSYLAVVISRFFSA